MPAQIVRVPGGFKVRWRDGTKNASGKYIQRSSPKFIRKAEATAEKRRIDAAQRVRRELRKGGAGRILSLEALLEHWGQHVLTSKIARQAHVDEVTGVLKRIFKAEKWHSTVSLTAEAVSTWRSKNGGRGTDKPLAQIKALARYAQAYLRQPVDPTLLVIPGRRGARRRAQPPLLRRFEVDWLIALAENRGGKPAAAIIEHLATYGCRPIDACRLRIRDFNAAAGTLTLRETKNGETVTHPLLPAHVARYTELAGDRGPDDPLFVSPYGEAWRVDKSAGQLLDWYTANVSEWLLPRQQWGLYLLKDFAISTMDRAGIDDRTKALFTGHRSLAVFAAYKATNAERAQKALEQMVLPESLAESGSSAPLVLPIGMVGKS